MKKQIFFALFFVFTLQFSGQTTDSELAKTAIQYRISEYHDENEKHLNAFTQNLELALQQTDDFSEFKEFQKTIDSLNMTLNHYQSEKNNLILHHLSDGFYHFNYITKNRKIILKDNKNHEYFTEIHSLNDDEFLLIEQMDEGVFSCNYASVFWEKDNEYQRKKAFKNRDKLKICNFTHLQESIPLPPKDNQSLPEMKAFHYTLPVRKITFDAENKTINYGKCYNYGTEKTTNGKAKYRNGKFKIEDCDERLFFD